MHDGTRHNRALWGVLAIISLLVLGVAVFAATTREKPPIASVQVTESLSLDLAGVLTQTNRRVDLSPLSRRLFWRLPRQFRSMLFAFGRPAPSQLIRAYDIGPQDVKLVFVVNSNDGPAENSAMAHEQFSRTLANARMDHVMLTNGTDWKSEPVYLREEPGKGRKIIRTAQIADVPTTAAQLTVEFVGSSGRIQGANHTAAATHQLEITNPHY